jgi:hypothetical protein
MKLKTIQEKSEYYSFLHKQNLNGRESEDELFELGIQVGIEETELIQDEFAIGFAEWIDDLGYVKFHDFWICLEDESGKTSQELLEIYKKEKGL